MSNDRSKTLIPCFRDMDAYDLPDEFSHLQAQDMSKIGFINDIVRGIKKLIAPAKKQPTNTVVVESNNTDIAPLLKRAFIFLEDGNWKDADEYCERVLDIDPENAQVYLILLMSELRIKKEIDLSNVNELFINRSTYKKVMLFSNTDTKKRIEKFTFTSIYNLAIKNMQSQQYTTAINLFKLIDENFNDTIYQISQCENEIHKINNEYEKLNKIKAENKAEIEKNYRIKNIKQKKMKIRHIIIISLIGFIIGGSALFITYNFTYNDTIFVISNIIMYLSLIVFVCDLLYFYIINQKNKKYKKAIEENEIKYKPTSIIINNIIDVPSLNSFNNKV